MLNKVFSRLLAMLALLAMALAVQAQSAASAPAPGDEAIHQELRALLQNVESAVNAQEYDRLSQYFDPQMHVTPSNQEVLAGPEQIKPYFEKWFGAGRFLKSVHMTLTADDLTQFNPARDLGVSFGAGIEKYVLSDGRAYDIPTRWTASVRKGEDGKWRILTLHIGVDFVDNPVFNQAKAALWRFTLGGAAAGLALGLLLGWLLKRRKLAQ